MSEPQIEKQKTPATAHDLSGTTVGRFAIRVRLGGGGMGEVYLADDLRLKRQVALKRLNPKLRDDAQYHERLLREAEFASRLTSENIAAIYDVFESEGESFLVMEYVEGQSLRQHIGQRFAQTPGNPFPARTFLDIAAQCASALATAHEKGLVHRDIKPENIMLTPKNQVKILDFGVARPVFHTADTLTSDDPAKNEEVSGGTIAYMAPEVLLEKGTDARSDIFSLGLVLYEALTGKHPFLASTALATSNRILHQEAAPIARLNPEAPTGIAAIVSRMLAKAPEERYASAEQILTELRALDGTLPLLQTPPPAKRAAPQARRAWLYASALLALVAVIAAATYWITQPRRVSAPPVAQPIRAIAILPFRNLNKSAEDDYFGVGLAEVLSAKLTNARLLEVHAPPAAWDPAEMRDASDVGRKLNVDAVLSGSYQIEGGTLSLSYALIDVHRSVQIAGDALERPFTQTIQVEHMMASEILGSLGPSLSQGEQVRFTASPTQESGAFQAYLRGNYEMEQFWKQPSPAQLERVEAQLREALRIDPQFALAWVSLAKLHWIEMFFGYAKNDKILTEAEAEANHAIEADPRLGEAYAARALVEFEQGKLEKVRESLRQAFTRSPNCALAFYAAGFYSMARGLSELSVRAFRRARDLDPDLVRRELAFAYRYQVDLIRAEQQARSDLAAHPNDLPASAHLATILALEGKLAPARELESALLERAPQDASVQWVDALLSVREGKPFPVEIWLKRNHDTYWNDGGYCADIAGLFALLHQPAEALHWLRRAGELAVRNYPFMSRNPLYDNLRQDADFQEYSRSIQKEWETTQEQEKQDPLLPAGNW